jgi:hypothetical protein
MNRIKIKNFGAIKEGAGDNWIELNQTTIFYGEPNTGKTTILKLIALFTWLEKQIELKRIKLSEISPTFSKKCFEYYGLTYNFFNNNAVIECESITHRFTVEQNKDFYTEIKAEKISDDYKIPKILFVPQNRYLLNENSFINTVQDIPCYLADFLIYWDSFLRYFAEERIPIPGYGLNLYYKSIRKILYVKGENFKINIQEASQTIKQIAPLILVSKRYLGLNTYNNEYNYSIIDDVRAEDIKQIPIGENGNKTVLSMSLLELLEYAVLEENTNYYKLQKNGRIYKI